MLLRHGVAGKCPQSRVAGFDVEESMVELLATDSKPGLDSGQPDGDETPSAESEDSPSQSGESRSVTSQVALWMGGLVICALAATALSMYYWRDNVADGGYFVIVCLYAMVIAATLSDAALKRIPNSFNYVALILVLTLTMFIAPLLEVLDMQAALRWIGASRGDWGGIAFESLKGFGLCLMIGILSFAYKGLGGGDVKLLLALGALAGWSLTIAILINTLAVAAVIGLVNLVLQGKFIYYVQAVLIKVYFVVVSRDFKTPVTFGRTESPFCLSLLIAMILLPFVNLHTVISGWLTPFSM
jgi:Flp pilus assembly protein protease CpaA